MMGCRWRGRNPCRSQATPKESTLTLLLLIAKEIFMLELDLLYSISESAIVLRPSMLTSDYSFPNYSDEQLPLRM